MMARGWIFASAVFSLAAPRPAFAAAGPPLITDDPGTPGPNNWEINLAFTADSSAAAYTYGTPLVDLNYGWGERLQLKYQVPWSLTRDKAAGISHDGADRSQAGVKWRFDDKAAAGVAVSTYPQLTFASPVPVTARDPDSGTGTDFLLPVELEESSGPWDFNEELGYNWVGQGRSQYETGLVLTYNVKESLLFQLEAHDRAVNDFRDHELLANLGAVFALNKFSNALLAAGRTFHDLGGGPRRLLAYAGWQLHL
jgi:hypothetical protein